MISRRAVLAASLAPLTVKGYEPFIENFNSLNLNRWAVSRWTAPGSTRNHRGIFIHSQALIHDNMLLLKLNQFQHPDGSFTSVGSEIRSVQNFGYGIYEWVMRASSTASHATARGRAISGSLSGLFLYGPKSITEIDFEVDGSRPDSVLMSSWITENAAREHRWEMADAVHEDFHTYKFVWTPGSIVWYCNDELLAREVRLVPTTPSPVFINHWGTNKPEFGGTATPNIERYMWIKSFKFTPA